VKLELELTPEPAVLGQRVTGRITVLEGGGSRSLTHTVSLHEQTRDFDVVAFVSEPLALHQGDLASGQVYEFAFTLPPDAPPSFKAEHSELYWESEVTSNEPGLDTNIRRRLDVVAPP
jgi:hypothetical protein